MSAALRIGSEAVATGGIGGVHRGAGRPGDVAPAVLAAVAANLALAEPKAAVAVEIAIGLVEYAAPEQGDGP